MFMFEVQGSCFICFLFVMFAWVHLDTYQRIQLGAVRNIQVRVEKIIHFDIICNVSTVWQSLRIGGS